MHIAIALLIVLLDARFIQSDQFIFRGREYGLCSNAQKAIVPTKGLLQSIPLNFIHSFKLPFIVNSDSSFQNFLEFYLPTSDDRSAYELQSMHKFYGTIWPSVSLPSPDSVEITLDTLDDVEHLKFLCQNQCSAAKNFVENQITKQCECDAFMGFIENEVTRACECNVEADFEEDVDNPGTCICKSRFKFEDGQCKEVVCDKTTEIYDNQLNDCVCNASQGYVLHESDEKICVHPQCNYRPHYIYENGVCSCNSGFEEVSSEQDQQCMATCGENQDRDEDKLECVCSDGYKLMENGECVENCNYNQQILTDNDLCICDASNHYILNLISNTCECDASSNFVYDGSQMSCACDPAQHLILVDGTCVKSDCNDIGEIYDATIASCRCNEESGFVDSNSSIQNCECSHMRFYDSETATCSCSVGYINEGSTGCTLPEQCFLSRYAERHSGSSHGNQSQDSCDCIFMTERPRPSGRLDPQIASLCSRLSWRYLLSIVIINLLALNLLPLLIFVKIVHTQYNFVRIPDLVAVEYRTAEDEFYIDNRDCQDDDNAEDMRLKEMIFYDEN